MHANVVQRPRMTLRLMDCWPLFTIGGHLVATSVSFTGSDRYFVCGLCHHSHWTDEKTGPSESNWVPRVPQLVSGGSGLQTTSAGLPHLCYSHPNLLASWVGRWDKVQVTHFATWHNNYGENIYWPLVLSRYCSRCSTNSLSHLIIITRYCYHPLYGWVLEMLPGPGSS